MSDDPLYSSLKAVVRRNPLPLPVRLERPIDGAREDAEILLAFAVQSRRNLKSDVIQNMSDAEEKLRAADKDGRLANAAERGAFWQAYDELAVAMTPLSAHSIRSSMAMNAKMFPKSIMTPSALLAAAAVTVFLFCMVMQNFWVAGKSLLDGVEAFEAQQAELIVKKTMNEWALRSTDLVSRDGSRSVLDSETSQKFAMFRLQQEKLEELQMGARPAKELLDRWRQRANSICEKTIRFFCPVDENKGSEKLNDRNDESRSAVSPAVAVIDRSKGDSSEQGNPDRHYQTKHEVRIILGTLSTYIIPAAMGLLGALAFLLQSMATQLREYTDTPVSVSSTFMRVCLGAIAGVFGGLAGTGAEATTFKGVPALFIPFVFGYGIEILFSLLDRVVQTFTQPDSSKARSL